MGNVIASAAILAALTAIVVSLGSGLFFLYRDRSASRRTVNALTVRIVISVALFLTILVGLLTGVVVPNQPF